MDKRILFIAVRSYGLYSSRRELIQSLIQNGYKVITASGRDRCTDNLIKMGVEFEELNFFRGGLSFTGDLKMVFAIRRLIRKSKPDLIHIFHSKPSILANLACVGLNIKIITTMTGLGHSVMNGGLKEKITALAYKLSLWKSSKVIFLNPDDLEYCRSRNIVRQERTELIISSGIVTENYKNLKLIKPKIPRVLFAGRLLKDKGVYEFVEAAEVLKEKYEVEFIIAGEVDETHPASVSINWIQKKHNDGIINYIGYCNNMNAEFVKSTMFVLPSYGEGVPRVILEASASGLPIITTDVNGCRTAVKDKITGLIVGARNSKSLADAIEYLLNNPEKATEMGQNGQAWIMKNFDRRVIMEKHLEVYKELGFQVNAGF